MGRRPHRSRLAVRGEYGRLASTYERIWSEYLARTLRLTADHLRLDSTSQVLDVGCGTGLLLDRLGRTHPGAGLVGVDLTPRMLAVARRRLAGRALLAVADAAALPFPDGRFDVLVSSSVLHYLPEPERTLAEWRRVLRPGGQIVITDWCRDFTSIRALDFVLRRLDPAHDHVWNVTELHAALVEAGFTDVDVSRHRQGWFWGMMAATAEVSVP